MRKVAIDVTVEIQIAELLCYQCNFLDEEDEEARCDLFLEDLFYNPKKGTLRCDKCLEKGGRE